MALCLYRTAQEALRNVVAHADASRAEVRLLRTGDFAEITITDDGKGFDITRSLSGERGWDWSAPGAGQACRGHRHLRGVTRSRARVWVRIPVGALPKAGRLRRRRPAARGQSLLGRCGETRSCSPTTTRSSRKAWRDSSKDNEFDVVGAVGDGGQLIDAAKRLRPDVIVTDLSMPGLSGLDVLARLKAEGVDSKVIVLTMHHDANLATIAMRGGAAGYLLKESAGEELLVAIRQALQGRVYLTPALTKEVMERMAGLRAASSEPELTPRQRDVLRLIVKGQRMKEIAANLGLSTRTVETHKYEMMETLGLHSTAELVRYALDRGLNLD